MWLTALVLCLTVALLVYSFLRKKYSYFKDRNIPYEKPKSLLGSTGDILDWNDVYQFSERLYWKFKGPHKFGGVFCLTEPEIVITDLDLVMDILVNDFKNFPDHQMYCNGEVDPLSTHLYALTGERWRNMRTKLSPAFSVSSIREMFDSVAFVSDDLVQLVDRYAVSGEPFIAKDVAMRYVCDAVGSYAFGMNCRAMMDQDPLMMQMANRLFKPKKIEMVAFMAASIYPAIADYIPWVKTPQEVQHYFMGVIKETVAYREQNNIVRNDFMNLLIQMKNKGCLLDDESGEFIGNLTVDELVSQAYLLFFLSYHNCRITLTFALYELARNPQIQERARQEICQVLGIHGNQQMHELNYQKLEEMKYMQQIADETMRKYPPCPHLDRMTRDDYRVKGTKHVIEKGTMILIPIMGIQNDPEYFLDPHVFDPDRMTPEKMRERHPATFLPFGAGPRVCLGYRFGYLQVKLALVNLLSQFRFSLNCKTKEPRGTNNFITEFSIDEDIWLNAERL